MIRTPLAGAALVALMATGAVAQDQAAPAPTGAGEVVRTQPAGFLSPEDQDLMRASAFIGREIYAGEQSIGEVSDIILSPEGRVEAAIVDVGGFLGAGERRVAIPFAGIEPQAVQGEEQPRLTVALDRGQIEALPVRDDQIAAAPPRQGDQAGGQGGVVVVYRGNQKVEDGETAPRQAVETAAPQQTGQAPSGLSVERLMGARVHDLDDENIGAVDDVIFTRDGDIRGVVVNVGGFLGLGEKPVAIRFDALNVQQDEGGDLRLAVNATQEQLKNAPEYPQAE